MLNFSSRPRGLTDKASDFESEDCGFESRRGRPWHYFFFMILWFFFYGYNYHSYFLQGEGFDVMKSGDARVALIGFPSVGKV